MKINYKFILLSLTTFNVACASLEEAHVSSKYKKSENVINPGDTCDTNCIWSSYAVESGLQRPQISCGNSNYCACVEAGQARNLCTINTQVSEDNSNDTQSNYSMIRDIPYYNQYDNQNAPAATCQNTSIAMVLSFYGDAIHPDVIFNRWGKDYAQSPSGLNTVYNHYAKKSALNTNTNASIQDLQSALSEGHVVIVHGYFTSFGHVLVVSGFDNQFYYVNDPAGVWSGCFKCGYNSNYNGVTKYSKTAFENAVFTSNGVDFLPGWIHVAKSK